MCPLDLSFTLLHHLSLFLDSRLSLMSNITIHFEERRKTFARCTKVGKLVEVRLKPLGQAGPGRHVSKPRVQEDDGSVISRVSDDSAHRLVGGPEGLQLIPFLAGHRARAASPLVIQELPLELHPGVLEGRVGEAGDEDGPSAVIRKVQALCNFAPAHGHEAGAPTCPDLLIVL